MEFLIGVLSLFFLLFVVFGGIAALRIVRALQRGVERTGTQVRRTVEETSLKARSVQPGPVGELARRRLELRASIDGTRSALEAGAAHDPSLREAVGLLDRLHDHARQLDGELQLLMEREPDKARAAARLPEIRERVTRIRASADSLRFAAQDRAHSHGSQELASLHDQIQIEAGALRHWERVDRADGAGGDGTSGIGPGPGPGSGPESGGGGGGVRPELRRAGSGPKGDRPVRSGLPRWGKGRPRNAS